MTDAELCLYKRFLGNNVTRCKRYRIDFHDGTTREGVPWTGSMQDIHDPDPTFFFDSDDGSRETFLLRYIVRVTEIKIKKN